jgi:trans-aconitate methyltransferase
LRRMHGRWPGAQLVGVDVAEGMIAQVRHHAECVPTPYRSPPKPLPDLMPFL